MPLTFALRRLAAVTPTFLLVSILIFALVRLLPGDPAQLMLGEGASAESVAELRERLGLNRPVPVQYLSWFGDVLRLDFGTSNNGTPVSTLFAQKLPITLQLTFASVFLSLAFALLAGTISALKPGSALDRIINVISITGICLPTFFTGILLIFLFSITLRWLPSSGYIPFLEDPVGHLRLMLLPAITLAFYSAAVLTRYLRSAMLEALDQDYVRTGTAKGVARISIVLKHALRNAIIPVVTVLGLQIGVLIGGSIITEQVFSIPGLGNLLVVSVLNRDLSVIQGTAMVVAVAVFIVNFLVDVAYAFIDPRIRF